MKVLDRLGVCHIFGPLGQLQTDGFFTSGRLRSCVLGQDHNAWTEFGYGLVPSIFQLGRLRGTWKVDNTEHMYLIQWRYSEISLSYILKALVQVDDPNARFLG